MFNALDFYPTPKTVVDYMLNPYKERIRKGNMSILEPSSGKGDILQVVKNLTTGYCGTRNKIYAFEQNAELATLSAAIEGVQLLGNDFFEYQGGYFFDLILMNPPFSEGAKHLLFAWEILEQGDICCLLNEETVKNTYTSEREQLSRIIEQHGTVEYLGSCFATAQRKTNVNVALVRLTKKAKKASFDFDSFGFQSKNEDIDFTQKDNFIATNDIIGNLELSYNKCEEAMKRAIEAINEANYYAQGLNFYFGSALSDAIRFKADVTPQQAKFFYLDMQEKLKKSAWSYFVSKSKIKDRITSSMREEFEKFLSKQENVLFNKANMLRFLEMMIQGQGHIIEKAIEEVFDKLTSYSEKNVNDKEAFKTNSHYKVNRKFIVPSCGHWDSRWGGSFQFSYHSKFANWVNDLDVACCHLTGKKIEAIKGIEDTLRFHVNDRESTLCPFSNPCKSEFFSIRVYKKGTVHLTFLDEELWHNFNIAAAKSKNWLTDETDKKRNKNR